MNYPEELPIVARRGEILDALQKERVLIVAGETGSGKTTQLPKMCIEAGLDRHGVIGCTQPRRVAATSVARRVAEELQLPFGREIGCKVRFHDETSRQTRVKFMTDGILLSEVQADPLLRRYSTILIDEAHERSLNIDFLLGYLRRLLTERRDLRLLITSATIDTALFSEAFGGARVIEVSGRTYPVEIRYAPAGSSGPVPLDEDGEPSPSDFSLVETALRATEEVLLETQSGDVLIFMPTERDIRETRDSLEGTYGGEIDVLALFGRMPMQDQQRIFSPGAKRRVVVATNIAETSLTIPRIRYVIDTGLCRMSRYSPRTRTRRLPVEPVSQSSANQRAGRAGRLQDGVCVRLYTEEDFVARPRFTQPEIQRANLAEVILRMKAHRLGDVETFPFIEPPQSQAIRAGYALLRELGALDSANELTSIGRELAALPVDPTLGRMLLHAREEGAVREVCVIAAGLSIPDPRERPEDQREAADTAHRAFAVPDSDFATLLNLWNAAPPLGSSSNAMRKFCRSNFLSMTRMREWRDIYQQLADAVRDEKRTKPEPGYEAIHRSILAGLPSHVAQRQERNSYKTSGGRMVLLFPGSVLSRRLDKKGKEPDGAKQPEWIMAAEIVQTSALFARTAARVDPEWIPQILPHLCAFRYIEPHWSTKAERVLVTERTLLFGLEVSRRLVDYGRIEPAAATEIFIRSALVNRDARIPLKFFSENEKLRQKLETAFTKVRSRRIHDLDQAFYDFYAARIESVSSVHDLNRWIKPKLTKDPAFLCATEEDLIGTGEAEVNRLLFPDQVPLANTVLPVSYAYDPGEDRDGVTIRVPLGVAESLSTSQLQWFVPGLRREQTELLLRGLPKAIRRQLLPLEPKIVEVADAFQPGPGEFLKEFAQFLTRTYRVPIEPEVWGPDFLPKHLRPRLEVIDGKNRTVTVGRDLETIRRKAEQKGTKSDAWEQAARGVERDAITSWNFGDLPAEIEVERTAGVPLLGYPGLALLDGEVCVRLFRKREYLERESPPAIRRLAELSASKDIAWIEKELRGFSKGTPAFVTLGSAGDLQRSAMDHVLNHLFRLNPVPPLTKARFDAMLAEAHRELPLLIRKVTDTARELVELRQKLVIGEKKYPGLAGDLDRLLPVDFLARTPHERLPHLARYLKAVQVRAERAWINPAKDAEKARQLEPFLGWEGKVPVEKRDAFRWMLEEFRVSIFAQELGTAQPVSLKRLREFGGI